LFAPSSFVTHVVVPTAIPLITAKITNKRGKDKDIAARDISPNHDTKIVSIKWNSVWKNMENTEGMASLSRALPVLSVPISTCILEILNIA